MLICMLNSINIYSTIYFCSLTYLFISISYHFISIVFLGANLSAIYSIQEVVVVVIYNIIYMYNIFIL